MTDTALKNVLMEIIADNQARPLDELAPRQLAFVEVDHKASVIIGVRRAGKTSYLHQIQSKLLSQGVEPQNIVEINFFDDRLHNLKGDRLGLITEAYYEKYPEKKGQEKVYFFFDELQEISGWEKFVERTQRTELSQIYISGSSAKMLSKEIASEMGGRALSYELFPFSFAEYLERKDIPLSFDTSKQRLTIQKEFQSFFAEGGFPEVFGLEERVRRQVHQEYFKAIVQRDVVLRHNLKSPRAANNLAYRLVSSNACLYTTNRMYEYLRSQELSVTKEFVSDCVDWFEDSYFLFSVYLDDPSLNRRRANPRKIYSIEHAFVASLTPPFQQDQGRLLENLIFLELRRQGIQPFYYRTARGNEVDFSYLSPSGEKKLVQVALHLEKAETIKRELRALFEALKEQSLNQGVLITWDDEGEYQEAGCKVKVMPAWRFLLTEARGE